MEFIFQGVIIILALMEGSLRGKLLLNVVSKISILFAEIHRWYFKMDIREPCIQSLSLHHQLTPESGGVVKRLGRTSKAAFLRNAIAFGNRYIRRVYVLQIF